MFADMFLEHCRCIQLHCPQAGSLDLRKCYSEEDNIPIGIRVDIHI